MKNFIKIIFIFLLSNSCVNAQNNYFLKVYLKDQVIDVYDNETLIKKISCSTGIKHGSTPLGKFYTNYKKEKDKWIEKDGSEIQYYYITRFNKYISFHSLLEGDHFLVDLGNSLYKEGKPSSMGCIRVSKDDAKWIYNLPLGAFVEITDN